MTLTPKQIELARHALGLTRGRVVSRNYFVCGAWSADFAEWEAMVADGHALRWRSKIFAGDDLFQMTRLGAEQVLRPGERLDPDFFPLAEAGKAGAA